MSCLRCTHVAADVPMTVPTHELCTLATADFVPATLVLHRSLKTSFPSFRLHVGCMDDEAYDVLGRSRLASVELIRATELEAADPELAAVRSSRLVKEYCWTAKSVLCTYLLARNVDAITWVDTDLFFYNDATELFAGFEGHDVQLCRQRMSADWKKPSRDTGAFSGGFVTFRSSPAGVEAARWWRDRCIEWCFARFEGTRWTDQRYLELIPDLFPGVRVLPQIGAGVAPWNARGHRIEVVDGRLSISAEPLLFYHFASLRLYSGLTAPARLRVLPPPYRHTAGSHPLVWSAWEEKGLTPQETALLWIPYVQMMADAIREARRLSPTLDPGFRSGPADVRRRVANRLGRTQSRLRSTGGRRPLRRGEVR